MNSPRTSYLTVDDLRIGKAQRRPSPPRSIPGMRTRRCVWCHRGRTSKWRLYRPLPTHIITTEIKGKQAARHAEQNPSAISYICNVCWCQQRRLLQY